MAKQLLEGPDELVYFAYNYSDHWRTEVAGEVLQVELGVVELSGYHQMMMTVDTDGEDFDVDDPKYKKAVVLK